MTDQNICRECGRIIRSAKYKDRNWTLYCSLKKLGYAQCARG
jgi:hypothetical protein